MRLILVRHGETEANIRRIAHGHLDSPLTPAGIEQAKLVAKRLSHEHIDVIYSSDLPRARTTAECIAAYHHLPVIADARLREQNFGVLDGTATGPIHRASQAANIQLEQYKPEGGESMLEMRNRLASFLAEVINKEKGKTVLFVTHGGPLAGIISHLLEAKEDWYTDFKHGNTGISIIDLTDSKKPNMLLFNDTSHLE